MSKLPKPRDDIASTIRDLRERIARLEAKSPFVNTGLSPQDGEVTEVIPGGDLDISGNLNVDGTLNVGGTTTIGGDLTVVDPGNVIIDGGTFTSKDVDGSDLLTIGPQGHGDRGVKISRDDGSTAIEVRKVFAPTDPQTLILYDRSGKIIGGEAILSPSGFDAPHMPVLFEPSNVASSARQQSTSSTSFVPLFAHRGFRQNPALRLLVSAWCSDGTTAAELQIYDLNASAYLGGFLGSPAVQKITIPAGTTAATEFEMDTTILPGFMGDGIDLEVRARVTAGSGSVSVVILRSMGQGI